MARRTPLTKNQSSLIVNLQDCQLLRDLTPENLGAMARYSRKEDIHSSQARKLLEQFHGNIVFIIEGTFERVFLPSEEAIENPSMAIVLNELKTGDVWGEHFLLSKQSYDIGIRCIEKGALIAMNTLRFESYMQRWPELHNAVLMMMLDRDIRQSEKLGQALKTLHNNDIVLNRIEGVADLLIDYMAGEAEKETVIQKRFKVTREPENLPDEKIETRIEQAYLHSPGNKEDRIRKTKSGKAVNFFRTTKIGKGLERKQYQRDITESEYNKLLRDREGYIIQKRRIKLEEKIGEGKIVIDVFEGVLEGLFIIEADFKTQKDADAFKLPKFLSEKAKDITEDSRYSNRTLAATNDWPKH